MTAGEPFMLFICPIGLDVPIGGVVVSVLVFLESEASVLGVGLVVIGASVLSSVVSGVTDSELGFLIGVESVLVDPSDESLTVLGD
jgi:hypothetical protein